MRIYSASSEETLRARNLLKDWASEGLLTKTQYQQMEQETVSELRTTNIFLRLVLFLFTVIIVGAGAALFFVLLSRPSGRTAGVILLIFAAVSYGAAEITASQARLYRYGIEEALAVCSVGFLGAGLQIALFNAIRYSPRPNEIEFLIPAIVAIFSLWIWLRFGPWYAFLAAMIFVLPLPAYWTSSHSAQHLIVAVFYATGLIIVIALRSRHYFDYLNDAYSLVEALLWLGMYLAINLQLSSLNLLAQWWDGHRDTTEFSRPFYWVTWVLIWCLPPIVLARGVRRKDRWVLAIGAIIAVLTLVSNKPYSGWQRHTWDPMLMGIFLTAAALFIRRWLAHGPDGIRHGFTAERLSAKSKTWMNAGAAVFGLLSPHSMAPGPQTSSPDARFGGGDSGGGGATSDF